ncbi:MAG: restriction endonuclease [Saprospiraceae bacterium]
MLGHQGLLSTYEKTLQNIKNKNYNDVKIWEIEKRQFLNTQEEANSKIDTLKQHYLTLETSAVLEYCDLVLNNSEYPENFPKSYELDFNPDNKILIVEYSLPSIEQFPTLNEVRVIKNELKEYFISEAQVLRMFDTAMYNITLRTIHELFEADAVNAIEAISFNGWVEAVNKATGKRENNCILSIQAKKVEFLEINLSHVEPKTCFKNLKGVGSSKLSGLTPIQPIMQINRTDKRFTNHYEVANSLDSSTNLASMDWEDFEHLIREVFAKEFSSNGGEVKVTQASRDGGVDAIAFDPDPIRGGKIVIQAKRYTNTVGVSAVRDLYGTVMNEGATKGILVTTADYGPDAYDFVKGKPLTLMNGANLLYLLEKHGHQARINIREAKEILK